MIFLYSINVMFGIRLFLTFKRLLRLLELHFFNLLLIFLLTSFFDDLLEGHDLLIAFIIFVRTVLKITVSVLSLDSAVFLHLGVWVYWLFWFHPLYFAFFFYQLWFGGFGTYISWILLFFEVVLRIMIKGSSYMGSIAITIGNYSSITSDSYFLTHISGIFTSATSIGRAIFYYTWVIIIEESISFDMNRGA